MISESFKSMSWKDKLEFIWDYHRWNIFFVLFAALFLISMTIHYTNYTEPVLDLVMINSLGGTGNKEASFDAFLHEYGYEDWEGAIEVNTSICLREDGFSYQSAQVLNALIVAKEPSLFFWTEGTFDLYIEQEYLADLSIALPTEILEKYQDNLIYTKGNLEHQPYPCAIRLVDNAWLLENGYYAECYVGVFAAAENYAGAVDFLQWLLGWKGENIENISLG